MNETVINITFILYFVHSITTSKMPVIDKLEWFDNIAAMEISSLSLFDDVLFTYIKYHICPKNRKNVQ